MDVEGLWQENKRFLMLSAAGGLFLLIGRGIVSSFYSADAARLGANAKRIAAGIESKPAPETALITAARKEKEALEAAIHALAERIRLRPVEPYLLRPGEPAPELAYNRVLQETRDRLAELASVTGTRLPYSLGLPDRTPGGLQEIVDSLRALQVLNTLVPALIDSGIKVVEDLRVEAGKGSGFYREVTVVFDLVAPVRGVERFLRGCASAGQEIPLSQVRLVRDEKQPRVVRATIRALAVSIDEDEALTEG